MKLDEIALRTSDGDLNAIIETPRGSRMKFAYDKTTRLFLAKKLLPLGYAFPFPFGSCHRPRTRTAIRSTCCS